MEVYARGPVAANINAQPLRNFMGGKVFDDDAASRETSHVVSIVGWGVENNDEERGKEYWILRNSWGSYWAEGGFLRVATGKNILGVEGKTINNKSLSFLKHVERTLSYCIFFILQKR